MFKLVIEDDEGNKTVVPIIRDEISIGRQDGNTIRLTERNVSRKHAKIVRENGSVFIEDVDARYGTKKNGEKLDGRAEFDVGDVFNIGDYRLTLQSAAAQKKPPKVPEPGKPPPPKKAKSPLSNQPTQITSLSEQTGPTEGTEVLPADPAKLVIISSNFAGQEFPLARKSMVIGRGEECDIIIDHRSVSQKHAKVVREQGGEYKIVDLKSKNGVKVGGEEYRAVHLKRGDIVELGHVKFRFVEPGENYVFTPQPLDDEFDVPASGKGKGMVVLGLLVAAVIAVVVAALILQPAPPTDEPPDEIAKQEEPVVAPDPAKEDSKEAARVEEYLDQAKAEYEAGQAREATTRLELARDFDDVTPTQVEEIDNLLSKARREKALQGYFETGRDHVNQGRYVEALRAFQRIPDEPPSQVYKVLQEQGLQDRAAAEVLAAAKTHVDDGEITDAKDLANAVLSYYDATHAEAQAILDMEEPRTVVSAAKPKAKKPKQLREISAPIEVQTPPQEPKKDQGRADELQGEAMKHFMKAQWDDLISTCKSAMSAGSAPKCKRLIAMGYYKKGDADQACRWFAKSSDPPPSDLQCE